MAIQSKLANHLWNEWHHVSISDIRATFEANNAWHARLDILWTLQFVKMEISPSLLFLPFHHFQSARFSPGMQHEVVRWKEKSWCWSRHEFRCWSFRFGGWILWTSIWFEFARRSLSVDKGVGPGLVWCVPKMCWQNLGIFATFAKAFDLEEEVLSHLREHGDCDMGALRQAGHRGHPTN